MLAHAALNAAIPPRRHRRRPDDDVKFEWRTIRDDRVRDLHQPDRRPDPRRRDNASTSAATPSPTPANPSAPPRCGSTAAAYLYPTGGGTVTAAAPTTPGRGRGGPPGRPRLLGREGGLPPDELHVTLGYYGDAAARPRSGPPAGTLRHPPRPSPPTPPSAGRGVIGNDDPPSHRPAARITPTWPPSRHLLEKIGRARRNPPPLHARTSPWGTASTSPPSTTARSTWTGWSCGATTNGSEHRRNRRNDRDEARPPPPTSRGPSSRPPTTPSNNGSRACLLTMPDGDPEAKSTYKLPIKRTRWSAQRQRRPRRGEPDRTRPTHPRKPTPQRNAKLRGAYRQLGEEPPDSLKADAARRPGHRRRHHPEPTTPPAGSPTPTKRNGCAPTGRKGPGPPRSPGDHPAT